MKTKRRHNRRRKRRRTRRHRRRRTRRRKTRRRRGAGNGMTTGEAALVARPEFKKIANAVILKWNNKGFYPVTKLTDAQIKKLGQQTARRVLKAMGGPDNTNVADGIAGAYQMLAKGILKMQTRTIQSLIDNLNRRSVATATARAAALPTAAALNAGGGGGGGDGGGGGEAIYDTICRKMLRHYLLHPIWQPPCLRRQPRRQ